MNKLLKSKNKNNNGNNYSNSKNIIGIEYLFN